MDEDRDTTTQSGDEALLTEIRDRYTYAKTAWEDIRKERHIDMRYICGDPWDPKDKKMRQDAGRPCINHDELNQYINQGVNNLRQNKRGIKVEPRGGDSDEKSAELNQDLIRTIEYRSKAQDVYMRAAQDMFEGSYGFLRVTRRYVDNDSDDQEIVIKPIPNPDSVLYDPDCKEADWSDAQWVFIVEPIAKEEFKRRWPDARKTDFTTEDLRIAKDWIQSNSVLVAEYWRIEQTKRKSKAKSGRTVYDKHVVQYITNGIEILERTEQPGEEIPIPAMIGLERYLDEGSGPKRMLFSLCRLARDPQMSLAYLVSTEAEEVGQSPKVPYMGYTGQFETDSDAWEVLNKVPRAYVQVDPTPDPMNPGQVLPLPQRQQFIPNLAGYDVAKESARRAIQAAIGSSPLPTAAQRPNQKSGLALEKIQEEQATGSYHFGVGFDRAVTRAGRIVESWRSVTYDTEREMALRKANDSSRIVTINAAPKLNEKTGQMDHFPVKDYGQHDVTVSTGPSSLSQRDAVNDFLDNLIAELPKLPIAPPQAQKLLAMAIKMKELGPRGDEMAEIIAPTEGDQSQQLQGMQQQLQMQGEAMAKMQGEFQRLLVEKQGKVIDNEYALKLKEMDTQAKLAVAEIATKAQNVSERLAFVEEFIQQQHSQAHDAAMASQAHEHAQAQAQQQADTAAQQQASDQIHQAGMAQQAQAQQEPAGA